jgi:hypothetical protein
VISQRAETATQQVRYRRMAHMREVRIVTDRPAVAHDAQHRLARYIIQRGQSPAHVTAGLQLLLRDKDFLLIIRNGDGKGCDDMSENPKRTGRPLKPAETGKRVSLGLKVTSDIKHRLDAVAKLSGRTQSQEAEARLERTFQDEQLLPQLLEIAYGREVAGLLLALGSVMRDAGQHAGVRSLNTFSGAAEWFANPIAYGEARAAAATVLDALRPFGDLPGAPEVNADAAAGLGKQIADGMLEALSNPAREGIAGDRAAPIRKLLGASVARIPDQSGTTVADAMAQPSASVPSVIARLGLSRKGKGTKQ